MTYRPPVADIMAALKYAGGLPEAIDDGLIDGLDMETVEAIIGEASRFGADVLAPLNVTGDRQGAVLQQGQVKTADGWREAYRAFCEAGWNGLSGPVSHGGQGLPNIVSTAVSEIWNAANLSFGLCPLLTQGAIHALTADGSEDLKRTYLARMVSGEWTGTMNLTEPQAGSDLGAIRMRAVPHGDGTYRLSGTKIFITYGEHDLTENIVHMVLARLPDAPEGTRGISLFLVPKFLVDGDGLLGARNDVVCTGVEHKLGIHGSPTCTMTYGENGGAVGYLVGEPNRGLTTMFIMMNEARLGVGVQGVAIAERAMQQALDYAHLRRQGRASGGAPAGGMDPIVAHPDVRRQLLTMRALTAAARAICFATAVAGDRAQRSRDGGERTRYAHRAALLTPVAKAFATDVGCEVASIGVQVHGGMGFIEETGAAQYYRDARILPIYEGTNGIQAIDLVVRKLPLENGAAVADYLAELEAVLGRVAAVNDPGLQAAAVHLRKALDCLKRVTAWLADVGMKEKGVALAGATPYLRLFAVTAGGLYLANGALLARGTQGEADAVGLARLFAATIASEAGGLADAVCEGSRAVLVASDWLDGGHSA